MFVGSSCVSVISRIFCIIDKGNADYFAFEVCGVEFCEIEV